MIYTCDQYYNCQPQMRQMHLLNKNGNQSKRLSCSQKPNYYFQQYGQIQNQYVYNQQNQDLNQLQLQSKSLNQIKHQQLLQQNMIGKVSHQQQNQFSQLDQLSNRSNQNQTQFKSIGQPMNFQQQQQQKQILKQANHNPPQKKSDAQDQPKKNISDKQKYEIVQSATVLSQSQKDQVSIIANKYQKPASNEFKYQQINRQISPQDNGHLKVNSLTSLDVLSKDNINLSNQDIKINSQQNKSYLPSLSEMNESTSTNSTQQLNDIQPNNLNNQLLNSQKTRSMYYSQSTNNMNFQQSEQQTIHNKDILKKQQQHYNIITQEQINLQNLNEILNYQTKSQIPQYQSLTSLSNITSTKSNNQLINQDQKQNQQTITNSFSYPSDQFISSKQNYLKLNNDFEKNNNKFSQNQSFPYDILNKTVPDYIYYNKSLQNYNSYQKDLNSIPKESTMTPKKQFLNRSDLSQRSLAKGFDTTDSETQEKLFSFQTCSNSKDGIQSSPQFNQKEYLNDFESPIFKLQMRETKYGNEDLCNYYPVSHISADDLSKYEIVIKCTSQTQNQNAINSKVKDFYDGFDLSDY